ncbi:MAG TPA: universal stress protein [Acidimicrobiales bacterium]|nr:universal stress protein [Acidimicrobiales bacterium]
MSEIVIVVVPAWLVIGLALSAVLGRRGHDGFTWFLLGAVLGPLAIALAVDSWRHAEHPAPRTLAVSTGADEGTDVDVLVGFDGSGESLAALATAVDLLGPRLGRLTLATVIPYDGGRERDREAVAALERQAERVAGRAPGTEVLRGHPAQALTTRAIEGGYELLAVGTRGSGRAHLFGSAASELARTSKVPVLLVGPGIPVGND